MTPLISLALASALSLSLSSLAQAADVTAAIGQSGDSEMVYRLGLQSNFESRWWASDTGHLSGYWDLGYTYWQGGSTASNHSVSLAPVFVYEFAGNTLRPYIEAGIGVALFSSTELDKNRLGSSFQFEDRLGFGVRFSGQEIGLRALHYSNAGIKQPNDGVEAYTLHYRTSF